MRPARTAISLLALVGLGALLLPTTAAAGGGGGGGTICPGFAQGSELLALDSCFSGTAHLVDADTQEMTVRNSGRMPHTVTAINGSFDLYLGAGETATLVLPDGAVTPIYCTLHGTRDGRGMAGAIVRLPAGEVAESLAAQPIAAQPIVDTDDSTGSAATIFTAALLAVVLTFLVGLGVVGRRRARTPTV